VIIASQARLLAACSIGLMAEGHMKDGRQAGGIWVHTGSLHLPSIYGMWHVHARAEAVARALRGRLICTRTATYVPPARC